MTIESAFQLSEADINGLLNRTYARYEPSFQRVHDRRLLVSRIPGDDNASGTYLPPPFHKTSLAIKTMLGRPQQALQHYASRIAANLPDIQVIPLSLKSELTKTMDRMAGMQERCDSALWEEAGGRAEQWKIGWAMSQDGVGYYLTLPRDANFGLPDRTYYDTDSDEQLALLVTQGKASAVPVPRQGKLVYAEAGDVWADRRRMAAKQRAINGASLFTLRAFPRDQVLLERDADGLKWIAFFEEIAAQDLGPNSELARYAAQLDSSINAELGLIVQDGRIVGGISQGGPQNAAENHAFVLIHFFTRIEHVVMVAAKGSFNGGKVVYRGKHGAMRMGHAVCPAVEVPFTRTDVTTPGMEFSSPLEQVFALVTLINQLLTIASNGAAYNGLPRWVIELKDGSTLRGEDGEPQVIANEITPGLDPREAAAVPGTLKQLVIDLEWLMRLLEMYLTELDKAMPPAAVQGASGTSEAAWHAHQMIEQHQANLAQPVANHANACKEIIQMWHGWLRQLDTPIYFASVPGHRATRRDINGVIEFSPEDFTDYIRVTQELDTPEEAVVRIQIGSELLDGGKIDDETFYAEYMKVPDARQAVKDKYKQIVREIVLLGQSQQAQPGSLVYNVAQMVQGRVTFWMMQNSPNFAIASAEQAVAMSGGQAPAYAQTGAAPAGGLASTTSGQPPQPSVAETAGVRAPGIGMAPTLGQQLGGGRPGGF